MSNSGITRHPSEHSFIHLRPPTPAMGGLGLVLMRDKRSISRSKSINAWLQVYFRALWFRFCTMEGNSDNAMATKRTQGRHLEQPVRREICAAPVVLNLETIHNDN